MALTGRIPRERMDLQGVVMMTMTVICGGLVSAAV